MSNFRKKILTLLLSMLLVFSFANIVSAISPFPPNFPQAPESLTGEDRILADNALQFLSDVANIDTSSYHIDVRIANEAPGVRSGKTLHFNLSSSTGIVDVIAEFTNGKLFWSSIFAIKGSPVFNQPVSSNVLTTAKDTLNRLQRFSVREYLSTAQNMLSSVTELKSSKTTNADFTQEITVSGNTVSISWEPFANGLSNPQNKLYLEFKNGYLEYYADYLELYTIGSSEVKISEAQAIQIAVEHARAFSWVQDNEIISNFTILDDIAVANISLQSRGNKTLFPIWSIMLPLDKEYPGGVTAFRAAIWADTGEVSYLSPIGFYGAPVPSSEPQQTLSPTMLVSENNQSASAVSNSLIIGLAIAAAAIITGYLVYRLKR